MKPLQDLETYNFSNYLKCHSALESCLSALSLHLLLL